MVIGMIIELCTYVYWRIRSCLLTKSAAKVCDKPCGLVKLKHSNFQLSACINIPPP